MIRREDIGREIAPSSNRTAVTVADLVAREALAGRSARIVGLGVLAKVANPIDGWAGLYRLTLTATVAKRANAPDKLGPRLNLKDGLDVYADVRHLARALGANVEVWVPGQRGHRNGCVCEDGARLVTTVHP